MNRVSLLLTVGVVGVAVLLGAYLYWDVTVQIEEWEPSYPGETLEIGGPRPLEHWLPFVICVGVGFCFACMLSLFFRKDGD